MGLTGPFPGAGALMLAALLSATPCGAASAEPEPELKPTSGPIALLALNGFDPVSYFLAGGPRAGSGRFELSWGGRVWRFASAANRAAFRADPAVYAPRLGGHDAAGVLDGRLVEADPARFAVIGERLYLFRDAARRARFLADPGLAPAAEAAWPGLGGLMDTPAE